MRPTHMLTVLGLISALPALGSSPLTRSPLPPIHASGWVVDLRSGSGAIGIPGPSVPGEIPVQAGLGIEIGFRIDRYNAPHYIRNPDGTSTVSGYTTLNALRPEYGTLHFGFIRNAWQSGSYVTEPVTTVLEDGTEADGTAAFSGTLLLPKAYGFATPSAAQVDDGNLHLFYDTTASGLSAQAASLLSAHLPQGFGAASTTYKVVMDKDRARVFASVPALGGWVPVLWLDRFGHTVTFTWNRATSGLPTGIAALTSVTVLNNRGKGVEVRWADWSDTTAVHDLARVDCLGFPGPSMLVRGYSGLTSAMPVGFSSSLVSTPPTATTTASVSVSGGPVCRPTQVQVGDPDALSQPSWSDSGAAPAAAPSLSPSTGPSVTPWQWDLAWDGNHAAVASFTRAPLGDSSASTRRAVQFTYQDWTNPDTLAGHALHAVTQVDDADGSAHLHRTTWVRGAAGDPEPTSVTVQDWWASEGAPDHSVVYSAFDADDQPGTTILKDANGTILGTTTTANGTTTTIWQAGLGLLNTEQRGGSSSTQVNYAVSAGSSSMTDISAVQTTFLDGAGMLASSLPTKVSVTRSLGASTPVVSSVTEYDTAASGQAPKLQPQRVYQQMGNWRHGVAYTYDTEGRIASQSVYDSPDGGTTVNPAPRSETYHYDATTGALTSATTSFLAGSGQDTLSQSWSGFDLAIHPTQSTDALGVVTTQTFDLVGRLTHVARAGQAAVDLSWSGDNETRTVTTANGQEVDTYDGFGRILSSMAADGTSVAYTYDPEGRVITQSRLAADGSSKLQTTSWTYDALGRVLSETDPDGVRTIFSYGLDGLATTRTAVNAATNLKVVETQDPFGQVVSRTVSDLKDSGYVVVKSATYAYDGAGHLTQVVETDPSGTAQTRTFTYNSDGRLVSKSEPETGIQTFSAFNALGLPTQISDAVRSRTLAYDGLGRLTSASGGSQTWGQTYSGPFLVSGATLSGGQSVTQSYAYGPASAGAMLTAETTRTPDFSATIHYAYDAEGRVQALTYPSGRVVTYGYDARGRVTSISQTAPGGGSGGTVATVGYDSAWGFETSLVFASGASSVWTTEADGIHLNKWSIQLPNGTKLDGDRLFAYDSSKVAFQTAGEWALTHDSQGRLTGATATALGGYHADYGYDAFDNNTSAALSGSTPPQAIGFSFPALPKNQTPATTTGGSATGWTYDAAGEATNFGAGVGSTPQTGLSWDGLGRLSIVTSPGLREVEGYAPSGLRVRRDDSLAADSRRYAYTRSGLLLGEYGRPATGADVHQGTRAVAIVHDEATNSSLARFMGTFSAGDTVTATVWAKAPAGTRIQMFIGNPSSNGFTPYDDAVNMNVVATGSWQPVTVSHKMLHTDWMWLYLYGDTNTTLQGSVATSFDDATAGSAAQGTTWCEGFESGLRIVTGSFDASGWRTSGQVNDVVATGSFLPSAWDRDVIYLGSQAIAEIDASGIHELHSDHLGTPRVITTASGGTAVVEGRQAFGPYGELFPAMNAGYAPLTGYTGHVATDPTGLIYMRGRFYAPAWHRFVNSDQGADPSTFNQMAYVGGKPMMQIDPSGGTSCLRIITSLDWEDDSTLTSYSHIISDVIMCDGGGGGGGGGMGGGGAVAPVQPSSPNPCLDLVIKKYGEQISNLDAQIQAATKELEEENNKAMGNAVAVGAILSSTVGVSLAEPSGGASLPFLHLVGAAAGGGITAFPGIVKVLDIQFMYYRQQQLRTEEADAIMKATQFPCIR